jgi:hypothetical protein
MRFGIAAPVLAVVLLALVAAFVIVSSHSTVKAGTPVLTARIWLCVSDSVTEAAGSHQTNCVAGQSTSTEQTMAVSSALKADHRIEMPIYLSELENLALAKKQQPSLAPYLQVGDIPASFNAVVKASDYSAIVAQYVSMPGVDFVNTVGRG